MAAAFLENERIAELLTEKAIEGLGPEARAELDRLAGQYPDYDEEALDEVAASLALVGLKVEPMPAELRARIEAGAREHFAGVTEPGASDRSNVTRLPAQPRPRNSAGWAGWFAAAASLVLAVAGWWRAESLDGEAARLAEAQQDMAGQLEVLRGELAQRERQLEALTPPGAARLATARAELAADPDSVSWAWATTDDPTAAGASGDVVWNSENQEGYMRFRGLAANDPGEQQYQLWIFDANRDDRFPVDGGVFDVPAGTGEVIVPIRAKLPVDQPALFAVTVERPGGVVVSSRERIAVLAQPEA